MTDETARLLADLARAKAAFQQRAVILFIGERPQDLPESWGRQVSPPPLKTDQHHGKSADLAVVAHLSARPPQPTSITHARLGASVAAGKCGRIPGVKEGFRIYVKPRYIYDRDEATSMTPKRK